MDQLRGLWQRAEAQVDSLRLPLQSRYVLAAAALTVVVVVVALLRLLLGRRRVSGSAVLLAGPQGSGKTSMFYQLRDGATPATLPSMLENEATFSWRAGPPMHVVDLPGHPRTRHRMRQFLPRCKAVVYVMDGVNFLSQRQACADQLYEIISSPEIYRRRVPLLLFFNKRDLLENSEELMRQDLETEMQKLHYSRTQGPAAAAAADADPNSPFSGMGDNFRFDQLPFAVQVASGSATANDLDALATFLRLRR